MENIQLDRVSAFSSRWKNLMGEGAKLSGDSSLAGRIFDWDGSMDLTGNLPAVFLYWWQQMIKLTFEDDLKSDWKTGRVILEEVLTHDIKEIIDNSRTKSTIENSVDISAIALVEAQRILGERSYSEISKLEISHPLSRVKILDFWLDLNRGPLSIGGDKGTLNANFNYFDSTANEFRCVVGPSMRFVLDWNDVDSFTINTNLGQSGNPFSRHYDDFLYDMQQGKRWVVPMSKDKIYAGKESLLILTPGL